MELFIEKQRVDVDKTFSTLITLAIDDIKDFGSKNTSFTQTIILPGTNNNNKLFGSIFDVTGRLDYDPTKPNIGLNFNAATSARAYLFVDNIQRFKGTIRILEVINDKGFIEYECAMVGELGGLVASIGNRKLEDLDFSAYNHTYSIANITGSWNNASAGSGYYYPLIDYGNYSNTKKNFRVGTFRPAFFVKEYIDKIFAQAGYTYDSAFLNTTRVKSWIIPNNRKELQRKSSTQLDISLDPIYNLTNPTYTIYVVPFNTLTTLGSFIASLGNSRFTWTGSSVTGTIKITIEGSLNSQPPASFGALVLKKNSSTLITNVLLEDESYGLTTLTINNVTFNTNDYLELQYDSENQNLTLLTFRLEFGSVTTNYATINIGEPITANDILPQNILQSAFLSSILKLSNLYVFEDGDNDKLLHIEPFIDFYTNAATEDWSNKLDRSKAQRIKPMSELNARYYEFNYASDSDFYNDLYKKRYNQTYGSYKYDSEFEFSKEVTKVDLIFAGTPLVGYQGEDKVYSTIFKKSGNTEEQVDSVIRILQAKKITGVSTWHIQSTDGGSNHYTGTEYGYAGHLNDPDAPSNDLNFGVPKELFFTLVSGALNVNQFNVFWSSYMAEITDKDSRLLTADFKLDLKDITNIDFSKLKWIDGALFRLNKIIDFNVTNPSNCKCELLKVINKIY